MKTLHESFDPKRNSLNAVRLVLASSVIVCHGAVITSGSTAPRGLFDPLVGQLPVDGFFALSGFLIAGSWLRRPQGGSYLRSRLGRLMPGYWVCILVTALVAAPVSAVATGGTSWSELLSASGQYIVKNAGLVVVQHDIAGTPSGVPYPGDWNASLWTLKWEMLCYLAVLALGVLGLMGRRWVHLMGFAGALALSVLCVSADLPGIFADASRFALMYEAGVLLYLFRKRIPVSWPLVVSAAGVIVLSAAVVPDYRLVAALPLGYVLLGLGSLVTSDRLRLRNDVSYGMYVYGFPVEQLLAHTPVGDVPLLVFCTVAIICTYPLAALSWFFVEKPAMARITGRRRSPIPVDTAT